MAARTSTQSVELMLAFPRPGPLPVRSGFLVMSVGEVTVGGVGHFLPDQCGGSDRGVAL
jgi:hypothetical protein